MIRNHYQNLNCASLTLGENSDKCGSPLENSMVLKHYPHLGFATPVWEITMNNLAFHLKTPWFGANTKIWILRSLYGKSLWKNSVIFRDIAIRVLEKTMKNFTVLWKTL